MTSLCPANGKPIAEVVTGTKDDYEKCVVEAQKAWKSWAQVTAPQRGLIFEILFNYQIGLAKVDRIGSTRLLTLFLPFSTLSKMVKKSLK